MKIKYELKKEDYLNFNMFNIRYSNTGRNALARFRFTLMALHIIIAVILVVLVKVEWYIGYPLFFVVALVQLVLSKKNFEKGNIKKISRMLGNGSMDQYFGEYNVEFSEEGFIEKSPSGENSVLWKNIIKIIEYELYLYLYIDHLSAYIIPKRAFEDEESIIKINTMYEKSNNR